MHSDNIYDFCLKNSYILIFSIYIIFRKKFEYL